jgi:WD40 repeat protein
LAISGMGRGWGLYEVKTGKELWRVDSSWGSTEPEKLAFSPASETLYAKLAMWPSWVLRRYDTSTGKHLAAAEEERGTFGGIVFTPDDRSLYSSSWDKRLQTWNASTWSVVRQIGIPYCGGFDFSPDGRLAAFTDRDGAVRLIRLDTGKELWRQCTPAGRQSSALAFSSDGTTLAISEWGDRTKGGHRIVFRSAADGMEQGQFNGLEQPAYDLRLNPDGRSLTWLTDGKPTFGDRKIVFQERSGGRKLYEPIRWAPMTLAPIAFSPDGKTLALPSSDSRTLDFLEYATWKKLLALPPVTQFPCPLAFSPDRLLFIVGDSDGAMRIFDAHTGRLLRRQEGHRTFINALVFSHDGRKLVTVSSDTTALVWDISDLVEIVNRREEIPVAELPSLWEDLAAEDGAKAYRAIGRLSRSGKQALSWMRQHLQPVPAADVKELAQLVADLDDDRFQVREKATLRLAELDERASPALRKALTGHPSAEVKRRAESLLKQAEKLSPNRLRITRCVEVAEAIGGMDAETLLKEWATGAAGATLTREAQAAQARLAKRWPSQAGS